MLGKLMKYEFRATGRVFIPLFAALLVVATVNRIFHALNLNIPGVIGTILSVCMIAAICVIALILTLQRFYRNLLKSEGYLMFTLPVSTDSLILSKLFVAAIWTVASLIVVFVAIAITAMTSISFSSMAEAIREILRSMREGGFNVVLCILEAIILAAATLFSGILFLYVCMALSLLVNRYRVGFAFLMYIVISTVGQIVFAILATTIDFTSLGAVFASMSGFGQIQAAFGAYFLCVAIPGALFYVVTRYMLKNRLNLE